MHSKPENPCAEVLERITDAFFALDEKWRFVYVNSQAESILQKSKDKLIGKIIWDECEDDDGSMLFSACKDSVSSQEPKSIEHFYRRLGKWLSAWIYPDKRGVSVFFLDITQRKTSELKLKHILESAPLILWAADKNGEIIFSQGRALESFNFKPNELVGKNVFEIFPEYKEDLIKAVKGESFSVTRKEKNEWFNTSYAPLHNGDTGTLAVSFLITDLKRAEENLWQEKLVREKFVVSLAHDLKTPLTAAKMSAQMINNSFNRETIEQSSSNVLANINRLEKMIQEILDANKLRAGDTIPIDKDWEQLDSIIDSATREAEFVYGKKIIKKIESGCVFLCKESITRALENLISNAIKYGNSNEDITISSSIKGENVEISVHNKGDPILENDINQIFNQFKRSSSASKNENNDGWGIGLAIVKGVAEAHGGSVSVLSSQENGTTFTISIPKC